MVKACPGKSDEQASTQHLCPQLLPVKQETGTYLVGLLLTQHVQEPWLTFLIISNILISGHPRTSQLSLAQQLLGTPRAYPPLLLLEESQLLLVHSRGKGIDLGQLGFRAHELLHGVSGHSPLDGFVDPPHSLEHCRGGQQEATQAE